MNLVMQYIVVLVYVAAGTLILLEMDEVSVTVYCNSTVGILADSRFQFVVDSVEMFSSARLVPFDCAREPPQPQQPEPGLNSTHVDVLVSS